MRRTFTILMAILAASLLAVTAVEAAAAASSPATTAAQAAGANVKVTPSMAPRGSTVTISGHVPAADCSAGVRLVSNTGFFPGDGFGPLVPVTAMGSFSTRHTIGASIRLGHHSVELRCGGGNLGVSTSVTVTAMATTASPVAAQPRFTG